jgi:putative ABC transport system permease protein
MDAPLRYWSESNGVIQIWARFRGPMATATQNSSSSFEKTLASAASTIAFRETLALAVDSFKASKARFLLTMLGMVIGSASIVLTVTVGLTGRQYALDQIQGIGPNMIEMQYVGGSVSGPENTSTPDSMTREDMNAVVENVPGIIYSSPMLEFHDRVSMGSGVTKDTMLLGVSPQYKQVRNLKILAGRFFDDEDAVQHTKVAVIVLPFAKALFGSPSAAVGRRISVSGIPFVVIGVFKEGTETFDQSEISGQTILIPYQVARYFQGTDNLKQIFFTVANSSDVEPTAARVLSLIQSRHRASSVYKAMTLSTVLAVMKKIADALTYVLVFAALITIVVSGVGIANSMLANVQARTREIGIRKALGATSKEIRLQFLVESVSLSLSGGVIGTVLGLAIPITAQLLSPVKIPVTPWSVVAALLTSVLVGVVSGTVPANKAASLDPVETLKYE